jgi:hypothetical protein
MAGLLDYLEGIGETGATLGTGLLSGVVGAPYGLFKGITSGYYGSPKANRIAEEEAKKFMERNTYVPRGKVAQEALQKAAQLMEASKLPPIIPEAIALGSIPRQAYLAQAERRGMDLERAMAPRVERMLERGGAGADVLRDLAQGTQSQIFVGPTSKTWNQVAANKALEMEKAGAKPEEIWAATGTFRGPEGKLRQEISDKGSKITEEVFNQISTNKQFKGLMSQGLQHEELYKAYPQSAGISTTMFADEMPSGSMLPGRSGTFQTPLITVGGPSSMTQRSTALHELQHAVQQKEGFAPGGSPSTMITELEKIARQKRQKAQDMFTMSSANDPLDPTRLVKPGARAKGLKLEKEARELEEKALLAFHSGQARFDLYRRLAGEAEARAVQKRRNLTPEERLATFPYESYDVPTNELIVRGLLN